MSRKLIILTLSLYLLIIFAIPIIVLGQEQSIPNASQGGSSDTSIPNPLGNGEGMDDPRVVIGMGIKALLSLLGSVALAVFIYGGFLWLTAGGNEQRIQKGKDVLIWATLGLMVVFAAYAIVGFFLGGQFLAIFFI